MFPNRSFRLGKVHIDPFDLAACLIIIVNASIRLVLIIHHWPTTNSDEATVGLMALHIAHGHDFPAFFYGQGFIGALEAYMGAALFFVFGPSVFALRFGVLLFYIAFLICMYLLTRLLYSKGLALVTLMVLGVGTNEILFRAIPAFAGHPETPLFGALIILLSLWLGLASQTRFQESRSRLPWRLILLYAVWGFVAGLALWNDALAVSFIIMGALFLLVCCRNTLRAVTIASISLGLLIGLLPVLLNDLSAPIAQKSFHVFGFLISGSSAPGSDSLILRFAASFLVSLPIATGGTGVCTMNNWRVDPWPITSHSSPYIIQCTAAHGLWAFTMIVTWLVAVVMEVSVLAKWGFQAGEHGTKEDLEHLDEGPSALERRAMLLRYARLMLLGSAALTWLVFTLSAQSIANPWGNNRYLIGTTVATPALLWPLWTGMMSMVSRPIRFSPALLKKTLSFLVFLCFAGALVKGTISVFTLIPSADAAARQQQAFTDRLVHMHLRHIYSEYWTCDLVSFLSQEQVVCSVLDEELKPGVNRYTPYVGIVARDLDAAYVFPVGSLQAKAFAERVARTGQRYQIMQVDDYMIYRPVANGP